MKKNKKEIDFSTIELVKAMSPDNSKMFLVNEEYSDGNYIHTSGIMEWNTGGGAGILYYASKGKIISAKWLDDNNLELIHEPNLDFIKKETESYFRGNEVKIRYKTE